MKWYHYLLVIIAIVITSIVASNSYVKKTEETYKCVYEAQRDSMAEYYSEQTKEFEYKLSEMESKYLASLTQKDSIIETLNSSTKTNKTLVRTVYKDSIREVYVENTETNIQYEKQIQTLKDSLAKQETKTVETEIKYVETTIHDTIYITKMVIDSTVEQAKTVVEKKSNWGVYGNGMVGYGTKGLIKEVNVGGKYHVLGPVNVSAGVKYDGDISGVVGIGIDYRF